MKFLALAPIILITSFEPFMGASVNNSMNVASALKTKLEARGYDVRSCVLPVVYDKGAEKALECFKNISPAPAMVISLGEAACDLEVETLMYNFDSTPGIADNAGEIRTGQPIIAGAPREVSLDSTASSLYCALDERSRKEITPSSNAGGFVCNNTAYRLALEFKKRRVNFSFMHVPAHYCSIEARDTAGKISSMVSGASKKPSADCLADFNQRAKDHNTFSLF